MDLPPPTIRKSLLPLSWLYGVGVNIRNLLFNRNILRQKSFDIPVICVGNLTVGGTGKTPHIEYLVRLLSPIFKVAVLSRGYKRKSKGFTVVETDSKLREVGDEPLQIKRKFPEILVVVDKKRVNAIKKLCAMEAEERPDVILLDDGFQHRHVKPSLSILLVDSNRPVFEDTLLPAGQLREPLSGKDRASMVVVTKCYPDMQPLDFRIYSNGLELFPYQKLYFSTLEYGTIKPLFPHLNKEEFSLNELRKKHLFLVTGIASPQPLVEKLEQKTYNLYTKFYPDHHSFTEQDVESIRKWVDTVDDNNRIILTTEKDAIRFRELTYLPEEMQQMLYYIPIDISFVKEKQKDSFNKTIIKHVRKYQTNGRISEK